MTVSELTEHQQQFEKKMKRSKRFIKWLRPLSSPIFMITWWVAGAFFIMWLDLRFERWSLFGRPYHWYLFASALGSTGAWLYIRAAMRDSIRRYDKLSEETAELNRFMSETVNDMDRMRNAIKKQFESVFPPN